MGFETTTLCDLLDHGGSWVQIPSGTQTFSEFVFLYEFEFTFHIMLFPQYKPFSSQYKNIDPSTIFFPVQKYSILA